MTDERCLFGIQDDAEILDDLRSGGIRRFIAYCLLLQFAALGLFFAVCIQGATILDKYFEERRKP